MEEIKHGLYLVPTPIGNISELSNRAIFVLNNVDYIFCEDTRVTSKLLNFFDIKKPLISLHEHNERTISDKLIGLLKENKAIAYVSDAGAPCISDPGNILVNRVISEDFPIYPLSGPSALINALIGSGLNTQHFYFHGFLNNDKAQDILDHHETIILYEAPHRFLDTMHEIQKYIEKDRQICIARELTKVYEEFFRGTIDEVIEHFNTIKGEIVIVIDGKKVDKSINEDKIKELLQIYLVENKPKEAILLVSKEASIPKNLVYDIYLKLKNNL
jgi:16S rRNA (cytidine1402-2'-O)-methyltransferase